MRALQSGEDEEQQVVVPGELLFKEGTKCLTHFEYDIPTVTYVDYGLQGLELVILIQGVKLFLGAGRLAQAELLGRAFLNDRLAGDRKCIAGIQVGIIKKL